MSTAIQFSLSAVLVLIGVGYAAVTSPALIVAMCLVIAGAALAVATAISFINDRGLASLLPEAMRHSLCERQLLDFLRDDRPLLRSLAPYRPFLFALEDDEVAEYLRSAPPAVRARLAQRGLASLLPPGARRLLLGRKASPDGVMIGSPVPRLGTSSAARVEPAAIGVVTGHDDDASPSATLSWFSASRRQLLTPPQSATAVSVETSALSDLPVAHTLVPPPPATVASAPALETPAQRLGAPPSDDWGAAVMTSLLRRRIASGLIHRMDAVGLTASTTLDAALASSIVAISLTGATALRGSIGTIPRQLLFAQRVVQCVAALTWLSYVGRSAADAIRQPRSRGAVDTLRVLLATAAAAGRSFDGSTATASESFHAALREAYREGSFDATRNSSSSPSFSSSTSSSSPSTESLTNDDSGVMSPGNAPIEGTLPNKLNTGGRQDVSARAAATLSRALRFDVDSDGDSPRRGGAAGERLSRYDIILRMTIAITTLFATRSYMVWRTRRS